MRLTRHLAAILLVLALGTGTAAAANICRAGRLSCATTMPVDGYCECTAHGATESGTVMPRPAARRPVNAASGGCGANPAAPGCR